MARISLRAYNRDIEALIDGSQIDEAFAHCRYILERYPKHIDTYRLMGKALLEAQRFADASDVFHRVLSSVPDDFIAHLGMSIIREDESNFNAAIWHMERSFEVQPSNAAVQVELRRLYGLRDGSTPQKIQLTRGALARMSAKSNLFTQAIAELRAALSNDPQRPDLQVVLAEMYAQTGARMEAVESCNSLISKLPYCLVANRILAEILPDTDRAERAQEFKERLSELDPYYAQLTPVAPTIDQVPDGAVTIERFVFRDETSDAKKSAQPEWAASLGVNINEEFEPEEESPDWLKDEAQDPPPASSLESETDLNLEKLKFAEEITGEDSQSVTTEPDEEDVLPDWMGAGVQPEDEETIDLQASESQEPDVKPPDQKDVSSQTPTTEISPVIEEDPLPEEQQEAEPLPDWMSDAEQLDEAESVPGQDLESHEPDLNVESVQVPSDPAEDEPSADWIDETAKSADIETPDWLHEVMTEAPENDTPLADEAVVAGAAGIVDGISEEDQPDRLDQDLSDFTDDEDILSAEDDQEIVEEFDSEGGEEPVDSETPLEGSAAIGGGITAGGIAVGAALAGAALGANNEQDEDLEVDSETEFLSSEPSPESDQNSEDDLSPESGIPTSQSDIPDWLQDLGQDFPVETEQTEASAQQDGIPENDEQDTSIPVSESEIEHPEQIQDVEQPPVEMKELPSQEVVPALDDDELAEVDFTDTIPDWLSEVSPEEAPDLAMEDSTAKEGTADIVQADIPDWLRKMEQEHKAELAAAGKVETAEELEFDSDVTELTGEDVPSWLMSAMDTELPGEAAGISEVEDISEIISEPTEEVLEEKFTVEDKISAEPVEEEPDAVIELEATDAPDVIAAEIVSQAAEEEILEGEIEADEDVPVEEIEAAPLIEDVDREPVAGVPEIAAAGLIADQVLKEGDTQPVKVREPADPAQTDVEDMEAEDVSPLIEEQPLTEDDEDAAMAWLESLAVKQGAAEDELLTSPEERIEEPPKWIQETVVDDETLEDAEEDEKIDPSAAAAIAGVAVGALVGEEDEDEQAELPDEESPIIDDTSSDWVPEITEKLDEGSELEMEEPLLVEDEEPEDEVLKEDSLEPEFEQVTPEEVSKTEAAEQRVAPPEELLVEEPALDQPAEDIPDWLNGLAEEDKPHVETPPAEWTPAMLAEEETAPEVVETPPEAKIDLNSASLSQLEKIPGIGFIHAQRIINYRTESGSFKEVDELQKVPELSADMIDDLKIYLTVEVIVEAAPPPSSHPELQDAWNNINDGEVETAVDQYTQLINRDELLDEVIRDLQEALGKYPQDASLFQSLGDAYMHSNMLPEALDAYNRAEDLIK